MKVLISGIGVISAIGSDVSENLHSLKNGESGVGAIRFLKTNHKLPACEVKMTNEELAAAIGLSSAEGYSRTTLLAMKAAKEAVENSGIATGSAGFISANTVGGMDRSELAYEQVAADQEQIDFSPFTTHECADSTRKVAAFLGLKGYQATISTACSSSANAIILAAKMIEQGMADVMVAGGVDALTKFTLNGFNSLMILDSEPCRPFDDTRKGLNLGEGAGFVVLESEAHLRKRGGKALAQLSGFANTNDAFHQTASSPEGEGAFLAMTQALKRANITPEDISYVNVHGTGTSNNDASESQAMLRIFDQNIPLFSSTKAFTGHTLGAAGGIEAVYSVMAIQGGCVFPNLRFKEAIAESGLVPQTEFKEGVEIQHVLSNSLGFGGNSTSLVISKA